jgi:transposase
MELRKKGVTLQLLWTEYQEMVVDGSSGQRPYQYSQFCDLYRDYQGRLSPTMRQVHRAGEKAFIDFSGRKPRIIDPVTGEATEVELFVMVLGASSCTREATRTQLAGGLCRATVRGLEYFGAVPAIWCRTNSERRPETGLVQAEIRDLRRWASITAPRSCLHALASRR